MSKEKPPGALKKWAIRLIILASLVWTAYNWSGLAEIKDELSRVVIIMVILLICEVCFVSGAILMLVGAGNTFRGVSGWIKGIKEARQNARLIAEHISTSRVFRVGFNLNWVGAVGTGVVLFGGVLLILPITSWGLAVLPFLDIVASFGWRCPIDRSIRALKEAA